MSAWILGVVLCVGMVCLAGEAGAFSQGMTAKVRMLQKKAFAERLRRAQEACSNRNFTVCSEEARLALGHAMDEKSAEAARLLIKVAEAGQAR